MRPVHLLPCLLALHLLGAEPALSKEDQAAFDSLKAEDRLGLGKLPTKGAALAASKPDAETRIFRVQVIRSDRDNGGFELVLVLDAPVPAPAVIRGFGHAVGEKLEYEGGFEGAAKFEGAYYPFLKSAAPVVIAAPVAGAAAPAVAEPGPAFTDADEQEVDTTPGFNAFTVSKILFAGFAIISIAMVVLRTKAKIEERAIKRHRRR